MNRICRVNNPNDVVYFVHHIPRAFSLLQIARDSVTSAKAGLQFHALLDSKDWIPAFAGMTVGPTFTRAKYQTAPPPPA